LVLDAAWMSPTFDPPRRQYELSHTYDGVTIVGPRLAELIRGWPGVRLDPLPAAPMFCRLGATQLVEFDLDRGRPRQSKSCETCHRFTQIALGRGRWLRVGASVPDGLARTDLEVGSAFDRPKNRKLQHPLLIVNHRFWSMLDRAGLGIHGDPVRIVSQQD
jgi:hypothetical protein